MKIDKQLLISLLIVISQNVLAVHDTVYHTKVHAVHFGLSGTKFAVRDYATSPLIYKGVFSGIRLGAYFVNQKSSTSIDIYSFYGKLRTRNYPLPDPNRSIAYNNLLILQRGYRMKKKFAGLNWYYGGQLSVLANIRDNQKFYNSNLNYEGFGSLGPLISAGKEFSFEGHNGTRRLLLNASLSVPVVNLIVRPPFNTIEDFVNLDSNFSMQRIKVASFGKFILLNSQVNLTYYLQNGNSFMLNYLWYFYNYYPDVNNLRGVAGHLSFSFVFKLNK